VTVVVGIVLALGVLPAWLGTIAFFRLRTPFERIHVVTFVNIAATGPIVLAALIGDGLSSRTLKCMFLWLFAVATGGLLAHVTGRAIHLREGERR
jgi:multicomponent Na+:H+ antiporter subunit G